MGELKKLIKKRDGVKSNLTWISKFIENYTDTQFGQISSRVKICEEAWEKFNELQDKIEILDDSDEQINERDFFMDAYCENMAGLNVLLGQNDVSLSGNSNQAGENQSGIGTNNEIKLPAIEVPTFYGAFETWLEFRDIFIAMVDSNKSLSDTQKFYYLKRSLKGDAADVVRSLENSTENYREAWDLLKETYENKKLIALSHIEALYNFPVMGKESFVSMKRFVNQIRNNIRSLKNVGVPVEHWDIILVYILEMKLDPLTKREWKRKVPLKEFANLSNFIDFVTHKGQYLEAEKNDKGNKGLNQNEFKTRVEKYNFSKSLVGVQEQGCSVCMGRQHHDLQNCQAFMNMSVGDKRDVVAKERVCYNCLKKGHGARYCRSRGCTKCARKHNTILHVENISAQVNRVSESAAEAHNTMLVNNVEVNDMGFTGHVSEFQTNKGNGNDISETLLSTVMVDLEDGIGNKHELRALLDCGSQSSFMTLGVREMLGLPLKKMDMNILGIGSGVTHINKYVHATVFSKYCDYTFREPFLIIENISNNIPAVSIKQNVINIPEGIKLGDRNYGTAAKVDLLIGASVFWDLLETGRIKLGTGKTIIQETKLGWIVSGPVPKYNFNQGLGPKTGTCNLAANVTIQKQLETFWVLEEYPKEKRLSAEEEECEKEFLSNTTRDDTGRFVVALPFKNGVTRLGKSYEIAKKRLHHMERRLEKDEMMKREYHSFIEEYLRLGHMSKLGTESEKGLEGKMAEDLLEGIQYKEGKICYLPHHGVYKETSSTTKLRVVFDASAATSNGASLNNRLLVGPKLQDDIFWTLTRFRQHEVVITGDIAKMYRQVWIKEEQRDYQRILWRFNSNLPIEHFKLNTITYGMASASYLAVRCLQQLGKENQLKYPKAGEAILRDFYMDDFLSGAESIEAAIKLRQEVSSILATGGFHLRKWRSNRKETIIDEIDDDDMDHYLAKEEDSSRTLGLLWDSNRDKLHFEINARKLSETEQNKSGILSKRIILSCVAQVFDPLGLIGPIIVRAKLLLQSLWKSKVNWDEEVPSGIGLAWTNFKEQLESLGDLHIDRQIFCSDPVEIELDCFCDASNLAYGACIYARSKNRAGEYWLHLICAKSRIAPLKVVSLPRLELCGALLGARLCNAVVEALGLQNSKVRLWCDSTIVLCWLAGEPIEWNTFVANRTTEIQELSKGRKWRHVRSQDNPADIISRGMDVGLLKRSDLWWHGPKWLSQNEENWPQNGYEVAEIPERRAMKKCFVSTISIEILERYSCWVKLLGVTGFCLRFMENCRKGKGLRKIGSLTVEERQRALEILVRLSQKQHFETEIRCLKNSKGLPKSSKLISLNPFLDELGILRVGGRLAKSELSFEQSHPIILSEKSHLTILLIRHEHYKMLHAGAQALLANIRLAFWPIGGRRTVRSVLRKCIVCYRVKPRVAKQLMGNLPRARVTPSRPFSHCGIDFCGPFETKVQKVRGAVTKKTYLCVFICFATHAVHLELVEDLTTQAFLNSFKRFIARRGLCSDLYSDNGTNFVGANNEIQKLLEFFRNDDRQNKLTDFFSKMFIRWHFIPPRSPHFGGLWESAIKSAKFHIRRVVGEQILSFEELYTVATQIESCMNSRPLLPLSEDPSDLNVLTPGHFLVGSALTALPHEDLVNVKQNRLKRYQLLTQMIQGFWSRWSKEYITTLQQRNKWRIPEDNVQVGALVLLKDDDLPPLKWLLGRVIDIHTGSDGQCRVVTVKTSTGVFKRAIAKLCIIPIEIE